MTLPEDLFAPPTEEPTSPSTTEDDGDFSVFGDAIRRATIAASGGQARQDFAQSQADGVGSLFAKQNPFEAAEAIYVPPAVEVEAFLSSSFQQFVTNDSFTAQDVASDARALGYAPEIIYALMEQWEAIGTSANVLDALHSTLGDPSEYEPVLGQAAGSMSKLFSEFGRDFTNDEKDMMTLILSAVQTEERTGVGGLLAGAGAAVTANPMFLLFEGRSAEQRTAEARNQLAALAMERLRAKPLETDADRKEFFVWFFQKSGNVAGFIQPQGTFNQLGELVAAPFRETGDAVSNAFAYAASPEDFAHRQFLSFGQNVVLSGGIDPSESSWDVASGTVDALLNLSPVDPINFVAGASAGIKAARTIPRGIKMADGVLDISKGRSLLKALRPFSGRSMDLPLAGRGTTARVFYTAFSKTADQLIDSKDTMKAIRTIQAIKNGNEIAEKFPALKMAPNLRESLARADDVDEIKSILRAGTRGGFGVDQPQMLEILAGQKNKAARTFAARWDEQIAEGTMGLVHQGDEVLDFSRHGVWVPARRAGTNITETVLDEGVTASVKRNLGRLGGAAERGVIALDDGTELIVRGSGKEYAVFDDAGTFVGGLSGSRGEIAVEEAFRGQGIGRKLTEFANPADVEALRASTSVTQAAANLLDVGDAAVFKASEVAQDGATKTIVPSAIVGDFKMLDMATYGDQLAMWAGETGNADAVSVSAKFGIQRPWVPGRAANPLSELAQGEIDALLDFARQAGADAVKVGDEMVVVPQSSSKLRQVPDIAAEAGSKMDDLLNDELYDLASSTALETSARAGQRQMWMYVDMPRGSRARKIKKILRSRNPRNNGVAKWWRRTKSTFKDQVPSRISLTDRRAGASSLKGWLKAIGADQELINKWASRFESAGTSKAQRRQIVFDAMMEAGDRIDNPLLRHNMIEFMKKSNGVRGYERAADGSEIGLLSDGTSTAISLAMHNTEFVMPEWSQVNATLRRYRNSKIVPSRVQRGWGKTAKQRTALTNRYKKAAADKVGRNVVRKIEDEDLLAMAYSDVLGEGRGAWANSARKLSANIWKPFHHTFAVAQLAGRPIAWASRVLLEETVRANMTSLPSVWRNPYEFFNAFFDAHAIRKMPDQIKGAASAADEVLVKIFDPAVPDAVVLDNLKTFIPDIAERAEEAGVLGSRVRLQAFVGELVAKDLAGEGIIDASRLGARSNPMRRALLKPRKKIQKTQSKLANRGMPIGFGFDDVPDIANRTMHSMYIEEIGGHALPQEWKVRGMSVDQRATYGSGFGRQIGQVLSVPDMRATAQRMAGMGKTPDEIVRTAWWGNLRETAERIGSDRGWQWANQSELAARYMDEVQSQWIDTLFQPFWTKEGVIDVAERRRIITELGRDRRVTLRAGGQEFVLEVDSRNPNKIMKTGRDLAEAAYLDDIQMPPINGWVDPKFGQGQGGRLVDTARRLTDFTMYNFGERASQTINRQPAFLHTYDRWYKKFRTLGWDVTSSQAAAQEKAAETVNYVFFNNMGNSRFLQRMNGVVPFFSAWWEVLSTWAYKIPAQEHLFVGYPALIRRTDRFFDGLVHTGIATPTEDGFQLNLSPNPETGNPVGDQMSRLGHAFVRTPFTIAETLANIGRSAFGEEPVDWSAWVKDDMSIQVGNPVNWTDHGVMAVNQWGFGFTPLLSGALAAPLPWADGKDAFDLIPFGVDERKVDLVEGETLVDFFDANPEVDPNEFIARNSDALKEALGRSNYNKLIRGEADPSDLVFRSATAANLSGTSLARQFIDDTFFPFGKYESPLGPIGALTPNWVSYVGRGLGLLVDDDPQDNGFIGAMFGKTADYQIGAELIAQYRHLEASEGLLTKQARLVAEFRRKAGLTEGDILDLENIDFTTLDDETLGLYDDIEILNAEIAKRAQENAAGALIMRGMLGFFGPSTPRMFFAEQQAATNFWATRQAADAARNLGSEEFLKTFRDRVLIEGNGDMEQINTMLSSWLEDGTGDELKSWIRVNHPGIMPFLQGTTYWGPAGPPPEIQELDEFFKQVQDGERAPYPADVFAYRVMRAGILADREISLISRFGNDPADQLAGYLENGLEYRAIMDEYSNQLDSLEWFDLEINDGAYIDWRDRNSTDTFTVLSELEREFRESRDLIDDLELALNFLNLTQEEQQDIIGKSRAAFRELITRIESLQAEVDRTEFSNPREKLIAEYYTQVSGPYYEDRNALFDQLANVETKEERSVIFDNLRRVDNDHFLAPHSLEFEDEQIPVLSEVERKWRLLSPEEQERERLSSIGSRPEWLSLADVAHIAEAYPEAREVLPATPQEFQIYDQYGQWSDLVYEAWRNGEMTEYERNKALNELDTALLTDLWQQGRSSEVLFWPCSACCLSL